MKSILVGAMLLIALSVQAQDRSGEIDALARLAEALKSQVNVYKRFVEQERFREWFFSDEFESLVRNNKGGTSIGAKLKGLKFQFGGENESSNAWEMREKHMGDKGWTFDLDHEIIISQSVIDPRVAVAIVDVIKTLRPPQTPLLRVELDRDVEKNETFVLKLIKLPDMGRVKIVDIAAVGLAIEQPPVQQLKGSEIPASLSITLRWNKGITVGTFLLNVDSGNSIALNLNRDDDSRECIVSWDELGSRDGRTPRVHRSMMKVVTSGRNSFIRPHRCRNLTVTYPDGTKFVSFECGTSQELLPPEFKLIGPAEGTRISDRSDSKMFEYDVNWKAARSQKTFPFRPAE